MTATLFNLGDTVSLQNVFKVSGAPTDPTTITLVVTDPTGTPTTYTFGDATLTRAATGTYTKDLTANVVGIWLYTWTGTGTAKDVADGTFTVFPASDRSLYCTPEELKAYMGSPDAGTNYDTQLRMAAESASRSVDATCGRMFWLTTLEAHTFVPRDYYDLKLCDDIGSTTGLIVATDNDADGVYETVWDASDYELLPYNAPYASPEAEPWTQIKAVGTKTFPLVIGGIPRRMNRVQITARWGWPAIPAAVRQATLIKAARIFHRRNSPQGIATFDDFGAVRVNRQEDGDVVLLLEDYISTDSVMIA